MMNQRTSWRALYVALSMVVGVALWQLAPAAAAQRMHAKPAGSTYSGSGLITISPASTGAVPSGKASVYTISFSCSGVAGPTCGSDPTITIPITLTSSNPATPAFSSWTFSATSSIAGLISSQGLDQNGNYVIQLNESEITAGDSDTLQFSLTPPNYTTPDGTSWSLLPTFTASDITAAVAPSAATGSATASANISTSKNTNDGGSVYVIGNQVIYNITAKCNSSGSTGNLYLTSGALVDTLPAGLDFVSASPGSPTLGTDTSGNTTITWDYGAGGDTSTLPSGCSANGAGATTYQVVANIDGSVTPNVPLTNSVKFSGVPIGASTITTTASKAITPISESPTGSNVFAGYSKSALGPLNVPGYTANNGFVATYPGHWITPINKTPSSSPGSAEGEYTVNVTYTASRAFTTALVDPVPCLTNVSGAGNVYSSNTPAAEISDESSVGPICTTPAFNPTVVQISSASLANAVNNDGWAPKVITTGGASVAMTPYGTVGSSTYFELPSGVSAGQVAAILLTGDSNLTDVSLTMHIWGYAASTLQGGDVLDNTATFTAYPTVPASGATPSTESASANLYIEPTYPQLGVYKSFGTLSAGPSGTTALTLQGYLATITQPVGNVVIADLLPYGLSWANPPVAGGTGQASFSVAPSQGGTSTAVTGAVQDVTNYKNTGRELIRITLPASSFSSGYYVIKAPTNLIELNVPTTATTYNNTAQEFVQHSGDTTATGCGPGTGTIPSTFQSSDPYDLDGDGQTNQNSCSYAASLTVPASGGPAFSLLKTAQGALDPGPVYPRGIANTTQGGAGTYTLTWQNTGGTALQDPVIYDILPYVGDTGVSSGQTSVARGSQFATVFSAISGALPSGVSVLYSTSTNPCRPEVLATKPGCDSDWSATPPPDSSQVKALEFVSTATYQPGSSFAVSFAVTVPSEYVNSVAWNSAAASAKDAGSQMLPAEPPAVGLTAPASPLTPTLSTQTSQAQIESGQSVTDTSTVGNTGGGAGTIAWQLVGPVKPNSQGTCDGLDWSSAAELDHGTIAVQGNGSYTTSASTPTTSGCYSYVQTLSGSGFAKDVVSGAGAEHETVLVATPTGLSVTKTADPSTAVAGDPITYTITATNAGPGTAYGVLVTDKPVSDMKLLSVQTPQGSCNDHFPLACEVGTIAAGQSVVIVAKALPLVSGTVANGVEITTTTPNTAPPGQTKATSIIKVRVHLGLRKRALERTVVAGHQLRFQLIVTNLTDLSASDVTLCDSMPAGLVFVRSEPRAKLHHGSYCWHFNRIAAHSKRTITLTTRALEGASGRVTNKATLSGPAVFTKHAQATVTIKRAPPHKSPVTG